MDHIDHLRNFQTTKTFMQRFEYTITLIKREVPWSLWELNVSQWCFEPSLVENDQLVVEKEILSECFLYLNIISPWKKTLPFIWTKSNLFYPRILCVKFGRNWPSGFGENYSILSMYFLYFVIIFPWKRMWPFIWTYLNSLHPRMLWIKFD